MTITVEGYDPQVSENVTTLLHRARLNSKEAALASGISYPTLRRRINGAQSWLAWEVAALAKLLDVTLDELAGDLPSLTAWQARRGLPRLDSNQQPSG